MLLTANILILSLFLALAVKQLSYALMQGSLFDPLRKRIREGMRRGVPGLEKLSELFSCKLCMTMQVSLWSVMLPTLIAGYHVGVTRLLLGENAGTAIAGGFLLLGSFLYAMSISAIALGLWIYLEYPAKRCEDLTFQLQEAQRTIEDLNAILRIDDAQSATEENAHEPA